MFTCILSNLQIEFGSAPLVRFYRGATVFSAQSETDRVKCLGSRVLGKLGTGSICPESYYGIKRLKRCFANRLTTPGDGWSVGQARLP
jgi:hypothetical protein